MPSFKCPFCDHQNPGGAKFCNECGSPLHLAPCRHCGAVNNVADLQCYKCGGSTTPARAADDAPADAQLHEIEERLRGFEHQLEELEAREAREPVSGANRASARFAEAPAPDGKRASTRFAEAPIPDADGSPLSFAEGPAPQADRVPLRFVEGPAPPRREGVSKPDRQPEETIQESGHFEIREPVLRVNERYEAAPRRERHRAVAALVAVIALALPAGGYVYYELSPRLTVSSGNVTFSGSEGPAIKSTASSDKQSRVDASTSRPADVPPPSPIAALSKASGGPTESRVDAGVSEAPPAAAPAPEAAPKTSCPPAVDAMALCDRIARAERR
jgi:hypothetical protein